MRIASYVGLISGCAGILALVYILYTWTQGNNVQGWTSIMVMVLIIGSAQLLCMGVFGEYLGRLYMESKQRPLFIIDEIVCSDKK
jgi:dolichol-phosphate mannosyltransferase